METKAKNVEVKDHYIYQISYTVLLVSFSERITFNNK